MAFFFPFGKVCQTLWDQKWEDGWERTEEKKINRRFSRFPAWPTIENINGLLPELLCCFYPTITLPDYSGGTGAIWCQEQEQTSGHSFCQRLNVISNTVLGLSYPQHPHLKKKRFKRSLSWFENESITIPIGLGDDWSPHLEAPPGINLAACRADCKFTSWTQEQFLWVESLMDP